jgi:hypothetical protein
LSYPVDLVFDRSGNSFVANVGYYDSDTMVAAYVQGTPKIILDDSLGRERACDPGVWALTLTN